MPSASPSTIPAPPRALQLQRRIERRALWRRVSQSTRSSACVAVLAIALVGAVVFRWGEQGAFLLVLFSAHPFPLLIAAIAIGWLQVQRARRCSEQAFARSWLATAPIDPDDIAAAVRWQVAARVLPVLAAMVAVPIVAALASGRSALTVIAIIAAGAILGSLAGWRRGAGAHGDASPRPMRLSSARSRPSIEADLDALARWPFAQMLAQTDARLHARMLAAVLLTMPAGTTLHIALLIVVLAASVIAAHGLLQALLNVIPQAAIWLRSTPLLTTSFTRSVCARSLAWLCAATFLISALVWALGGSALSACIVAGAVTAWSVTAIMSALARRYGAEHARIERWALGMLLLAVGVAAPALLCLALPVIWWWSWRRASTA